jgi:hypothetical protein
MNYFKSVYGTNLFYVRADFERFGMTALDDDLISILKRRVYDIAACNPDIDVRLKFAFSLMITLQR